MSTTVVDVLAAYRQEHQSQRYRPAVGHAAMRAVVSHDGWFAPSWWAVPRVERRGGVLILPPALVTNGPPPGCLWIFTGLPELTAARAGGAAIGAYSGPLRGVELFGALGSEDVTDVSINPVGGLEQGWLLDGSTFPCIARWVAALRLEASLRPTTGDLQTLVAAYSSYVICLDPKTRLPPPLRLEQPERLCLPAFTAPDRAEHFAGLQGGVTRSAGVTGAELFVLATTLGADGVVLNPDAGSGLFIPGDACRHLAELAKRVASPCGGS
jgi:hypothetical protein